MSFLEEFPQTDRCDQINIYVASHVMNFKVNHCYNDINCVHASNIFQRPKLKQIVQQHSCGYYIYVMYKNIVCHAPSLSAVLQWGS